MGASLHWEQSRLRWFGNIGKVFSEVFPTI